jgi:hypothetical protein
VKHPYKSQGLTAFWDSAISAVNSLELSGLYERKFDIIGCKLAAAGSCFAQHIGQALKKQGLEFLDLEPAPSFLAKELHKPYNYGLYSARYGNIYTSRQLLQLFDRAFNQFVPKDNIWRRGQGFVDPFRPNIEPDPFVNAEELVELRRLHLEKVQELMRQCQIFIFTLGLTETWFSTDDGAAYPVVPGTSLGGDFDSARYRFHNLSYVEIVADLELFRQKLQQINPDCRILLTVSPVPLAATALPRHVLVSTIYSKSVLRAAAGWLAQEYDDVDYFPSYEIIASHPTRGMFFMPDGRSVSKAGVEHVMGHFFKAHGLKPDDGHQPESQPQQNLEEYEQDPVCEELALAAFNALKEENKL